MATQASKRKATDSLEESTKKLRIKGPLPTPDQPSSPIDDDDEDASDYDHGKDDFSDDGRGGVDTPVTPFSPGRKKFPSEYKTIPCTYPGCTKTFNRPARMKAHLVTHTNERPYACPYDGCDKTYIEDKHLQQHIKGTHTQERKWVCDWEGCNKSFLTGTRLRRHKEAHAGHDRFRCTGYPGCNKSFRKHQTLQRHIRSDHLELTPFPCTYVDPITKEPCNAGFDGAVGLRKHVERLHCAPQFVCPSCTIPYMFNEDGSPKLLSFTTSAQLQTHIRKEHAECMFCSKKCSSHRELEKHIESQHSGKTLSDRKTIPCTFADCDKTFTKKSNLNTHISIVHNGERYICGTFNLSSNPAFADFDPEEEACGKDFASKTSLEDHIRTAHLGLPGKKNRNRRKASSEMDLDFIDDEDDEFAPTVTRKKKRKARKQKFNAIDELLGDSYAADPSRNIACLDPSCAHKFIREYDLEVHMRTVHSHSHPEPSMLDPTLPVRTGAITPTPAPEPVFQDVFTAPAPEELFNNNGLDGDIDWALQRQALEGGPFWVGAEDGMMQGGDNWSREEEEMRRLIDPELFM